MSGARFRLAMRERGEWWVAFAADPHTMDGAVELGRVTMASVLAHPKLKESFMELMRQTLQLVMPEIETWNAPVPAPNREREM